VYWNDHGAWPDIAIFISVDRPMHKESGAFIDIVGKSLITTLTAWVVIHPNVFSAFNVYVPEVEIVFGLLSGREVAASFQ
jgi:hypothetical protein